MHPIGTKKWKTKKSKNSPIFKKNTPKIGLLERSSKIF
jgi:hypothetical protein